MKMVSYVLFGLVVAAGMASLAVFLRIMFVLWALLGYLL